MARINVNPNAEVSDFAAVKAGTYTLRIEDCKELETQKGFPAVKYRMAITTPKTELLGLDGQALKGNPSSIFYMARTDAEAQGMLRSLVEPILGEWSGLTDFDTADLVGKEIEAVVKEDTYEGKVKNVIGKVLRAL